MGLLSRGPIPVAVAVETAFDYLVDPHHRPVWQPSLRRVEAVDVTVPGLKPEMRTTELERPYRWTEEGTWRGITATLTLVLRSTGDESCEMQAEMNLSGRGPWSIVARAAGLGAPFAVRSDLRDAAKVLEGLG